MTDCDACRDLHFVKGDLSNLFKPEYPYCPGHELSGVAVQVGPKVTKVKVGDHVGVGCSECRRKQEQRCFVLVLRHYCLLTGK